MHNNFPTVYWDIDLFSLTTHKSILPEIEMPRSRGTERKPMNSGPGSRLVAQGLGGAENRRIVFTIY